MTSADPKLLEIIVDPHNKAPLRYDPERKELVTNNGKRAYPVREGIPVMLDGEARDVKD